MESEADFLAGYDRRDYDRPSVAADVLGFTVDRGQLMLLLVKRTAHPCKGLWALPGGFIGMEETAEAAAARAFDEKAGVAGVYMEQLYTFSDIHRDPRMRIISVAYLALAPRARMTPGRPDAALFAVQVAPSGGIRLVGGHGEAVAEAELAFDHARIIRTALARMAGKLEYTDIGFRFLGDPRRFTLPELYDIFSAVAGRAYDLPNFRRAIKKRYEETGRIEPTGEKLKKRGAPAVVYRWKDI